MQTRLASLFFHELGILQNFFNRNLNAAKSKRLTSFVFKGDLTKNGFIAMRRSVTSHRGLAHA
jgi:Icc-related predicted phosphoesterase